LKTIKLANRVPTLIMLAFLTYASYSVHASLPDAANEGKDMANGQDVMMKDLLHASADEAKSLTNVVFRDPFQASQKPADAPKPQKADLANDSEADPLAELVKGLALDATFVQGQTQIAIINGRSYHRGQHLIAQGDTGRTSTPLFVQNVQMHSVTLSARGKTYELGYPDQLGNPARASNAQSRGAADGALAEIDPEGELAFYKRLLNSPLGKLGKGLTGNTKPGQPATAAGSASRSRNSRGHRRSNAANSQ
jgi:hypothetical protein